MTYRPGGQVSPGRGWATPLIERDHMDLRQALSALRTSWWLPVVGLVVGVGATLLATFTQTPLYASTTQLFVSTTQSTSTSDVFQGGQFSQQRVKSYSQLLVGEELAGRVVDRLGLDLQPSEVSEEINATVVPDTVLLNVTVTDPSPRRARDIAE